MATRPGKKKRKKVTLRPKGENYFEWRGKTHKAICREGSGPYFEEDIGAWLLPGGGLQAEFRVGAEFQVHAILAITTDHDHEPSGPSPPITLIIST